MGLSIVLWFVTLFLSYQAGKAVGRFGKQKEAIKLLRWLKQSVDDGLRRSIGSDYSFHVHIADEVVVCKSTEDASQLSLGLGEVISRIKPASEVH